MEIEDEYEKFLGLLGDTASQGIWLAYDIQRCLKYKPEFRHLVDKASIVIASGKDANKSYDRMPPEDKFFFRNNIGFIG